MATFDRRDFLKLSVTTAAGAALLRTGSLAKEQNPMRLGLIVHVDDDPDAALRKVHEVGLPTAQLGLEIFTSEMFEKFRRAIDQYGIEVTALNCSGPEPLVYDFYHGPETIGLVPGQYRQARIEQLKKASDFAKRLDIKAIHTHCGFIPENPNDPLYQEAIVGITDVVSHVRSNGQIFLFETGQETPITLLRAINDVGLDNRSEERRVAKERRPPG